MGCPQVAGCGREGGGAVRGDGHALSGQRDLVQGLEPRTPWLFICCPLSPAFRPGCTGDRSVGCFVRLYRLVTSQVASPCCIEGSLHELLAAGGQHPEGKEELLPRRMTLATAGATDLGAPPLRDQASDLGVDGQLPSGTPAHPDGVSGPQHPDLVHWASFKQNRIVLSGIDHRSHKNHPQVTTPISQDTWLH